VAEVIEKTEVNRGPLEGPQRRRCEDRVVINDGYLALIDGASLGYNILINDKSSGYWAAEKIAEAMDLLDPKSDAEQAVEHLTNALSNQPGYPQPPSASVVVYSEDRRELWRVGNAGYLINGVGPGIKNNPFDQVMIEARAVMVHLLKHSGSRDLREERISEQALEPWQEKMHHLANKEGPYGWATINGSPVPKSMIEITRVRPDADVVFGSGYPKLLPTLEASEKYLEEDLERDPLRIDEHRGYRAHSSELASFDDRAYLRFKS
jgi:hypothetical protein